MKKNKMMRIASVLLVAVLLSTSVISGTFAKYTTTNDATDTARVAKWGVEIKTQYDTDDEYDGIFKGTYAKDDDNAASTDTVVSSESDNLVAPGTKGSMTFSISGKPEVAVKVTFALTGSTTDNITDVKLPAGALTTVTEDYYPVVFTLKKGNETFTGNLAAIKAKLESNEYSKEYAPGADDLAANYELSWAWAFNGNHDDADTLLGDIAAGIKQVEGASTTIDFKLTITVEQVD